MEKVIIWHNPRCSKSREALAIADENSTDSEIFKYLDTKPSVDELKTVLNMLGFSSAREWMRTKEDVYKELDLKNESDEEKLLVAMAQNPKLIERPIVVNGDKAVLGRPPEKVRDFLIP